VRKRDALDRGDHLNHYELIQALGAGGMGEVWLAADTRLERKVAIKLLPTALTGDPARTRRFEQEARASSALNHPNVCTVHALEQANNGQHFIVMEHIEGQTLRARLAGSRMRCATRSTPPSKSRWR
jgi:serine/threonine protein kinase